VTPLRVDLVSEHASPLALLGGEDAGGQNVHVAALATELGKVGCAVTVYTRRDAPGLPDRVPFAPNVVVEHLDAGPAAPVPKDELFSAMPAFAVQLRRRWLSRAPDIAHAHFWMSGWAAVAAAGGEVSPTPDGMPLVLTFHALGVVKTRHQGLADTSPLQRQAVERTLLSQVDRVVATCTDEANELASLGAEPDRISVVPCGIDPQLFRPDGPRLDLGASGARQPFRLVAVSRLVPRKGVAEVIRALPALPGTELLVAGGPPDPDELERDAEVRRLRREARRAGVAARVQFLGGLAREQIPALLRSADVVVSAPWYEPFGIVPLEAMACGVPVVGTAVGGLLDTVQSERTGLLVEPRNPAALAAAIGRLLGNRSLRERMGQEGAALVRERFTWEQVALSTLGVYRQLSRDRSGTRWWAVPA
jgi:glycosyltransferase involved in cell wall biosynthesis